jgi:hypothetical protein
VVGSHGGTGLRRLLLGSVTERSSVTPHAPSSSSARRGTSRHR